MNILYEGYVKNSHMDKLLNELYSYAPEGARRVTINIDGEVYLGWACSDEDVAVAVASDPEEEYLFPWFLIQNGDNIFVFDPGVNDHEVSVGTPSEKMFIKYVAEIALSYIEDKRRKEERTKYYRMMETRYDVTQYTEKLERKNR